MNEKEHISIILYKAWSDVPFNPHKSPVYYYYLLRVGKDQAAWWNKYTWSLTVLMNICKYPDLCPWTFLLCWQALRPCTSLRADLGGQTCNWEMTMVPFILNGKYFSKSLANFHMMKFPRTFIQTFHFLECYTGTPPWERGVSLGNLARWLSLYIGSRLSLDEAPGQAQASFWSRKWV